QITAGAEAAARFGPDEQTLLDRRRPQRRRVGIHRRKGNAREWVAGEVCDRHTAGSSHTQNFDAQGPLRKCDVVVCFHKLTDQPPPYVGGYKVQECPLLYTGIASPERLRLRRSGVTANSVAAEKAAERFSQ